MKNVAKLVLILSFLVSAAASADSLIIRRPIPPRPVPGPIVRPTPILRERVLGSTTLSHALDRDVIIVNDACPSRIAPPARALRVRVTGAPARINAIRVRFQNGLFETLPVGGVLGIGERARIVDVPGRAQCVDSIVVLGETIDGYYHTGLREARVTISALF